MRKVIANIALLSALALAPCIEANAFTCIRTDLAAVSRDSTRIILGEVVKVERIQTPQGADANQTSEYVATLEPVETFKGRRKAKLRVKFRADLHKFLIQIDAEVVMVTGERYVLFEKEPDTLRYDSICEKRVKKADREIVDFVRSNT